MTRTELIGVVGVAAAIGLAITAWVYLSGLGGPEKARRYLGTHRLAFGAVISVLVLNVVLTLPIAPMLRVDEGLNSSTFLVAALSTQIPMMLFVYLRLIRSGALTWQTLGFRPVSWPDALRMGLGGGLVGLVVIDVIGTLLSEIGLRPNQLDQFKFVLTEGPLAFVLLLISAGVIAPVVEETFFRGFLFGMYRRRQNAFVAYAASSGLFTVLHLEPGRMNPAQMAGLAIGILLLALILAWLFDRTRSLYPSILAHAVNNATGLVLFYFVRPQ